MAGIVVVGAGQAGASLVAKLRAEGYAGDLTLIGAEPVLPYQRPPLSKSYLLGDMVLDRLYLRPASFYTDQNITLRLNTTVTGIDPENQVLHLGDDTLPYTDLALTTGSWPRRLPAAIGGDLPGTYTVRDLADVDAIAPEVAAGRRVLIVGGGYIGLEAAAVCARKGMEVTVVEQADRILQRVAAPDTSDYMRALHRQNGVTIREGVGLTRITGIDRVTGAILSDGSEILLDLVIVGVGIAPSTDLAEMAGCAIDNGIMCDAWCRTTVPHIWAAGDNASFPWQGRRIRLESVPNAIDMAETVATNMLGANIEYVAKPWFWSDQYDLKLQIAGLNTGYTSVTVRSTNTGQSHWYYKGDTLLAVDAMNAPRDYMVGKRLIETGKSPDPALVQNPSVEIKSLLRA